MLTFIMFAVYKNNNEVLKFLGNVILSLKRLS